jgi:N-acetylglucosamine malate deacetylase 2
VAVPARVPASRPGRRLPAWPSVLAVVAHPDDESFGLGAVIDLLAAGGARVSVLCYTHGEASTLNETGADLHTERESELRLAADELGAASVTLLDYPDGGLSRIPAGDLAAHAAAAADRCGAASLLAFDDSGITGHLDHRAATAGAVLAARQAGLPVLAWALPGTVAVQLKAETGQAFSGQPPDAIDFCVRVSRSRQRRAALMHASQVSPGAVLWRRLQLQGECEHLRWLVPPEAATG